MLTSDRDLKTEIFKFHLSKKRKCKTVCRCKVCGYSKIKNINKNHIVVDVVCLMCDNEADEWRENELKRQREEAKLEADKLTKQSQLINEKLELLKEVV